MMMSIKEYSIEDLLFKLPLYRKVKVDYLNLRNVTKKYLDYVDANYSEEKEAYEKEYSEDFKYLIEFIASEKKIFGYCDKCKRELSLKIKKIELEKELTEENLSGLWVEDIGSDNANDIDSQSKYKMNQKLEVLLSQHTYFIKELECTHNDEHKQKYIYKLELEKNGLIFKKIGQEPSSLELSNRHIDKKYSKLKKYKDIKADLSKSLLSYSNNFGVGAFVYLRRVLERIIEYKYAEIKDKLDMDKQEEFLKKGTFFSKKLNIIKDYLPEYLTQNTPIYSILSEGVHSLTEEDTIKYFPIIEKSIYIILDELLELQERDKLKSAIAVSLNSINSEIRK